MGDWTLESIILLLFTNFLSIKLFGNMWGNSCTKFIVLDRYQDLFYLCLIKLTRKHSKLPKDYIHDCRQCINFQNTLKNTHRKCSVNQGALKNFANFTGKHLFWDLFLIKLQAFRTATSLKETQGLQLFKKKLQHRCFPVKFARFLRAPILKNIYKRLLLHFF